MRTTPRWCSRASCWWAIRAAARAPSCATWRSVGPARRCAAAATRRARGRRPGTCWTGWTGPAYTPIYVELRSLIAGDAWALERTADLPGVPELREYLRARLAREGCEAFADELFDLLRGRPGGDPAGRAG